MLKETLKKNLSFRVSNFLYGKSLVICIFDVKNWKKKNCFKDFQIFNTFQFCIKNTWIGYYYISDVILIIQTFTEQLIFQQIKKTRCKVHDCFSFLVIKFVHISLVVSFFFFCERLDWFKSDNECADSTTKFSHK